MARWRRPVLLSIGRNRDVPMRILRRAEYRRMPWKNGQGLTEEEVRSLPFPAQSYSLLTNFFGWEQIRDQANTFLLAGHETTGRNQ